MSPRIEVEAETMREMARQSIANDCVMEGSSKAGYSSSTSRPRKYRGEASTRVGKLHMPLGAARVVDVDDNDDVLFSSASSSGLSQWMSTLAAL